MYDVYVTKECPLIIKDNSYDMSYDTIYILAGGYIEIRAGSKFSIKKLIKCKDIDQVPLEVQKSWKRPEFTKAVTDWQYDIIVTGKPGEEGERGEDGEIGLTGASGGHGGDGGAGFPGGDNGLPRPDLTLIIEELQSDISVLNVGGAGGDGGRGGNGGNGGDGTEEIHGGVGGDGGNGGNGGDGCDGCKLTIYMKSSKNKQIIGKCEKSIGGKGGVGGHAGKNGKYSSGTEQGKNGAKGSAGNRGNIGSIEIKPLEELRWLGFMDRYGGYDHIKEKYPAVLKAIEKTKEKEKRYRDEPPKDDMKETGFFLSSIGFALFGNENKKEIVHEGLDELKVACRASCTVANSPYMTIEAELHDLTIGGIVDSIAKEYEGGDASGDVLYPLHDLAQIDNHEMKTVAYYTCVGEDGTIIDEGRKIQSAIVESEASIIKYIKVSNPISQSGSNTIIMLYNRDPFEGENLDYKYTEELDIWYDGAGKAVSTKLICPISGEFLVSDNWEPVGFAYQEQSGLAWGDKGVVYYNRENDEIKNFFTPDENNPHLIHFSYDPDWNSRLELRQFQATNVDLKLRFSFHYILKNIKTGKESLFAFSITSTSQPQGGDFYYAVGPSVTIPYINIRWGCFHKDTLIKMAEGYDKKVSDIHKGDFVLGEDDTPIEVMGMVRGKEARLVHLGTMNGYYLEVSETHTILTARGIVIAKDLTPADLIKTEKGLSQISELYEVDYDDDVYNLDVGGKNVISNGIISGDYISQNSIRPAKKEYSEEVKELVKQMKEMFAERKLKINK